MVGTATAADAQIFPFQLILDVLLEKKLISHDQANIAIKEYQLSNRNFEKCLVELGFISESALVEVSSVISGCARVSLKSVLIDEECIKKVPQQFAIENLLITLEKKENSLLVAMVDIYNLPALDHLRQLFPEVKEIKPLIAAESEILEAIDLYYGYDLSLHGILQEIEKGIQLRTEDGLINPTVRLVNVVLLNAIKQNASDIHFEPEGAFIRIRYRIDGLLSQVLTLHSQYWPAICVRLKVMSEINIAETRRPQSGRFSFFSGSREVDLRVSSHPTIHGENIVVRILDKNRALLTLDELGYSEKVVEKIKSTLGNPQGILIITGPTSCGKTTTLYSILGHINTPEKNIMTLEEPVEYQIPLIRQSHVKENIGMGFTEGVRSILRQDPDVILIGEIRDQQTAQMALRAAMTGHQVLTTLHTNDVWGVIPRLADLALSIPTLVTHINAIIAQRLVRCLCPSCKKASPIPECFKKLFQQRATSIIYKAQGCSKCCYLGYKGRTVISEVLVFDEQIINMMTLDPIYANFREQVSKGGWKSLMDDALDRVTKGITSLEEVIRTINMKGY